MNTSALVLKYHRVEELVMRCIHQLTREGRLVNLNEALTELPDQIFAACMPNLSYVELIYHFPTTLYMCSGLINRFYKIRQRQKFPISVIDTLLYQLCLWLFKSTLQEQVQGRLELLNTVSNKLELLSQREMISIGQMLHEGQRDSGLNIEDIDSFIDPPLSYTQIEERISLSIELLAAVRPVQKQDDLYSLADSLENIIESDKSTVALIDKLSTHSFDTLVQDEPIDSILIRYLQGIEMLLSITDSD